MATNAELKICKYPGCTSKHFGRGYCRVHYRKMKAAGKLGGKICSVKGCSSIAHAKGFCRKHAMQMWRHGKIINRTQRDKNEIKIKENYALLFLYSRKGQVIAKVKIDIADVELVSGYKWYLNSNGYPMARSADDHFTLHKLLTGNTITDHISGDRLDNRRCNLRFCNHTENCWNTGLRCDNTSGVKGVYYDKRRDNWCARITVNKKVIYLGSYKEKQFAVIAREKAEKIYFKEFRRCG